MRARRLRSSIFTCTARLRHAASPLLSHGDQFGRSRDAAPEPCHARGRDHRHAASRADDGQPRRRLPSARPDARARRWASRQWIACVLEFKGRQRAAMMQPNRYTELFFLDEATALAAGHRPCFECRRGDAERFAALWAEMRGLAGAAPGRPRWIWRCMPSVSAPRAGSHLPRPARRAARRRLRAPRRGRPGQPISLIGNQLLAWSPAGYGAPCRPRSGATSRCSPPAPSLPYFQPDIAPCCIPRPRLPAGRRSRHSGDTTS